MLTEFYCDNNVKISALMMRGAKRKMRGQGEGTLGTQQNDLTINWTKEIFRSEYFQFLYLSLKMCQTFMHLKTTIHSWCLHFIPTE